MSGMLDLSREYSWGPSPEFPKQLSCTPFRFSCGGLRKGLLTFGTRVKRPFAQSAARRPKIAQSHKSCNKAPKFQLFPGSLPRISQRNPCEHTSEQIPRTSLANVLRICVGTNLGTRCQPRFIAERIAMRIQFGLVLMQCQNYAI